MLTVPALPPVPANAASGVLTRSPELPFPVASGTITVTDPCYQWCDDAIERARPGTWLASVEYLRHPVELEWKARYRDELVEAAAAADGNPAAEAEVRLRIKRFTDTLDHPGRVRRLMIAHEDLAPAIRAGEVPAGLTVEIADFTVGVDSGQAGFFDAAALDEARREEFSAFYDDACTLTLRRASWGTLPFGAVSSSGWGDGGYECRVLRDAEGLAVAAEVVFMATPEEEAAYEAEQAALDSADAAPALEPGDGDELALRPRSADLPEPGRLL